MSEVRRRVHWGWISGAVATAATVVGGLVTVIGYVQGIEQTQLQERASWAAHAAVTETRLTRAEQDIVWLRDRQTCK